MTLSAGLKKEERLKYEIHVRRKCCNVDSYAARRFNRAIGRTYRNSGGYLFLIVLRHGTDAISILHQSSKKGD